MMTSRNFLFAVLSIVLCLRIAYAQSVGNLSLNSPADPLSEVRTLLAGGHLSESESALRSYLASHTESADAHFLLGFVLFREHKAKESLAEFTDGAKFRRPSSAELQTVASDYVMLGDFEDADKWFTVAAKETPADPTVWFLLGRTEYNEGQYDNAISSFKRALSLREKYVEAENNLGLALHALNRPEEAKNAFQVAIDWQGATPMDAQPFLNLGTLLAEEGDNAGALVQLKRAVVLSPDNPSIHEQLGSAYETLNRLSEAKAELEQAIVLAPDVSALHFKLGRIDKKLGLQDQARHEMQICAQLNSTRSSRPTPNPPLPH